jgi:hypothetical protein
VVTPLEGADAPISLARAAQLSGLSAHTLRHQAAKGLLRVERLGREQWTTRRWLHAYLMEASERDKGRRLPLPADYQAPE